MMRKQWLDKKIDLVSCRKMKILLNGLKLNTVCREARCPNISECFNKGVATFMILGDICTRSCKFCAVKTGHPLPPDNNEPLRIKQAVDRLGLKYVVITSPSRDDLSDGGAEMFLKTVYRIKELSFVKKIEALIPDFSGDVELIKMVSVSDADIIAHNVETVPSLYSRIRPQSSYQGSLNVLEILKKSGRDIFVKSGIMLGLGETDAEVIAVLKDLTAVGCNFLSIGQYLAPSLSSYGVKEYIPPEKFDYFKAAALSLGFSYVMSAPYVRSSYLADSYLEGMEGARP